MKKNYVSYSLVVQLQPKSIPEKNMKECFAKAKAMKYVLLNSSSNNKR
jgi:hypothetical protein